MAYDDEDDYENDYMKMTKEPGSVEFRVIANRAVPDCYWRAFEIDILEVSGCAHVAAEGVGLDYWIMEHARDINDLREGHYYVITGMSVQFFPAVYGFVEEDEEWEYDSLEQLTPPGWWMFWAWTKWWHFAGWRIQNIIQNIMNRINGMLEAMRTFVKIMQKSIKVVKNETRFLVRKFHWKMIGARQYIIRKLGF